LIKKYGVSKSALDHADEVLNKRYREALQQQREQVMMSKQLAEIAKDAPIEVKLQELELRRQTTPRSWNLSRAGFNSLLKELGAEAVAVGRAGDFRIGVKADYRAVASCR